MAPTHATFLAVHCSWSRPSTFPAAVSMVMVIEWNVVDGGMLMNGWGATFLPAIFEQLSGFWREIQLRIPTWTQYGRYDNFKFQF